MLNPIASPDFVGSAMTLTVYSYLIFSGSIFNINSVIARIPA
jgi:hypothetical protein